MLDNALSHQPEIVINTVTENFKVYFLLPNVTFLSYNHETKESLIYLKDSTGKVIYIG